MVGGGRHERGTQTACVLRGPSREVREERKLLSSDAASLPSPAEGPEPIGAKLDEMSDIDAAALATQRKRPQQGWHCTAIDGDERVRGINANKKTGDIVKRGDRNTRHTNERAGNPFIRIEPRAQRCVALEDECPSLPGRCPRGSRPS